MLPGVQPIRVMAFDDHAGIRQMVKMLIDAEPDMVCAGTWPDCADLQNRVAEAQPDVVLMDISMPGIDGIEAVRALRTAFPQVRVVMQTVFEDSDRIFDAIYAGANGYLLKKAGAASLIQAIRDAYSGGAPMTPSVAARVLEAFRQPISPAIQENYGLSTREKEVLQLLAQGKSYKMIAADLRISFHTVDAHMRKIYEKLHVRSLGEAVAKAIRDKLV